jgi:hypothetical protein
VLTINQVLWLKFSSFTGSPIHPPPSRCSQHGRKQHEATATDGREPGVAGLPPDGEHGREHHEVVGIHGTEPVCGGLVCRLERGRGRGGHDVAWLC